MTPEPHDVTDGPIAYGWVADDGRGALPYSLIHGEALVAAAAWAAGEAGIQLADQTTPWQQLAEGGLPVVIHDALCPMTPPEFLAECVRVAAVRDVVVVGVRPVTDTVKEAGPDGRLGGTVDRDGLVTVCSPVVLPPSVASRLPAAPSTDFVRLVSELRASYEVEMVEAPAPARRVASEDDVRLLEALTDPR